MESVVVPYEVPLTVSEPELVVTLDPLTLMPMSACIPFAVPMMFTLPTPVAEMLEDESRSTPLESVVVPHEVPLTAIEPELVVTLDPDTEMPRAL